MKQNMLLTIGLVLCVCAGQTLGCTITGFEQLHMFERLVQSTYVVYGRTIWHEPTQVMLNGRSQYVIDATFEVHCILKEGEDPMTEEITISQISPEPDCFGTDVAAHLKVGDYSILALRNTTSGKYILEEVMPELTAAFSPTKPYLFTLANLCGTQDWKSPVGAATNKCPICGIADFSSDVATQSGILTNCEFTTNGIVSNTSSCDLYISGTVDYANAQSCVPATFNQSCVTLLYRTSSGVCDCTPQNTVTKVGTAAANVPLPSLAVTLMLIGLLEVLFGLQ